MNLLALLFFSWSWILGMLLKSNLDITSSLLDVFEFSPLENCWKIEKAIPDFCGFADRYKISFKFVIGRMKAGYGWPLLNSKTFNCLDMVLAHTCFCGPIGRQ